MKEVTKCQIIRLLLLPLTFPLGLIIMALTCIQNLIQEYFSNIAIKK